MSTDTKQAITQGNERVRRTMRAIQRYRRLSNKALGDLVGMHVNTVQGYTGGGVQITAGIIDVFAHHLGVEPYVLAMDEDDAMRWVTDHSPNSSWAPWDSNPQPAELPGEAFQPTLFLVAA